MLRVAWPSGASAVVVSTFVLAMRLFGKVVEEKRLPAWLAREQRVAEALERNTAVLQQLSNTLKHRDQLDTQRTQSLSVTLLAIEERLRGMSEDLAALFAKVEIPRPSKQPRQGP